NQVFLNVDQLEDRFVPTAVTPVVTIGNGSAGVGGHAIVPVTIAPVPALSSFGLTISYNTNLLDVDPSASGITLGPPFSLATGAAVWTLVPNADDSGSTGNDPGNTGLLLLPAFSTTAVETSASGIMVNIDFHVAAGVTPPAVVPLHIVVSNNDPAISGA